MDSRGAPVENRTSDVVAAGSGIAKVLLARYALLAAGGKIDRRGSGWTESGEKKGRYGAQNCRETKVAASSRWLSMGLEGDGRCGSVFRMRD